ncbi:MAG: HsmA family protein [Syntrophomonadaceae bacterium]|nr:HsmA family protein [Syntrophomonadaceae bacterium]MDD4549033.1 HsmA family protein [Syntrophomonadaceae bacterium]
MLLLAIILISLAFVFYTLGVWSEKFQKQLKKWHTVVFWVGFVFDTAGTTAMSRLTATQFEITFHTITGLLAILIMLFHAIWATIVLIKNNETARNNFRKLSVHVWAIWLIPYITGIIMGTR